MYHRFFDYRGVVVGVDTEFRLSDEWYQNVALTRPPRNRPWYRVLVSGTTEMTYVAERNLESDSSGEAVEHPLLNNYFNEHRDGYYLDTRSVN